MPPMNFSFMKSVTIFLDAQVRDVDIKGTPGIAAFDLPKLIMVGFEDIAHVFSYSSVLAMASAFSGQALTQMPQAIHLKGSDRSSA